MNREKFRINFALVLLLLLISAVSGWYNNWSGKLADKNLRRFRLWRFSGWTPWMLPAMENWLY